MIELRIYGKLRKQSAIADIRQAGVLHLLPDEGETVVSLLHKAGIQVEATHSIFLNATLLAARSNMARWLRYRQGTHDPLAWNLEVPVGDGDRVGVFGRDMAALVL